MKNPAFPFSSKFDRDKFIKEVDASRKRVPNHDDPHYAYLKSHGINYVVEAPGLSRDEVDLAVRSVWTNEIEFGVEPLFQQGDGEPVPDELRAFYLVTIANATFGDLIQNPYDAAYALLEASPFMLSVEPDLENTQFFLPSPTSPAGGSNPKLDDKAWALRNIRADQAWNIPAVPPGQKDGCGILIAHLDTGWTHHVDLDWVNFDTIGRTKDFIHPGGNAADPLNYKGNPGHGTSTGSVIMSRGGVSPTGTTSATATGTDQITGVARLATYVPVRCITTVVLLNYFNTDVAKAVRHATATGCDVVSMSLGGSPLRGLHAAIRDAVKSHLLVVCAAGNMVHFTVWPARYKESIAVAASNIDDKPWVWTCGGVVDISAPGEDVWKADPDAARVKVSKGSGTSYATAHVAGCAALWLAFFDKGRLVTHAKSVKWPMQELFRQSLVATARRWLHSWQMNLYGAGIVDAEELLKCDPMASLSGAVDATSARRTQPDPNDHLGLAIAAANNLLMETMASENRASIQAFEHELATIFLNEANDGEPMSGVNSPESLREVIWRRGSMTLESAAAPS